MISHLGKMLSLVVGGTWAARRRGRGRLRPGRHRRRRQQHRRIPRVAESGLGPQSARAVPDREQPLLVLHAHRASNTTAGSFPIGPHGYGITGRTIDGTDAWEVYTSVCDALETMQASSLPAILECMSLAAARPRRLRQGRVRAGREAATSGGDAIRLPAARQKLHGTLRHVGGGGGGDRASGRGRSAVGVGPGDGRRAARSVEQSHGRLRRTAAADGQALSHAAGQERRGRGPGPGLSVGEQPAGVPVRARRGRVRLGLQDLQGAHRAPRPAAGAGHAAVRIGLGRLRLGRLAGRRAADPRVPVRRFLHRSRHADSA